MKVYRKRRALPLKAPERVDVPQRDELSTLKPVGQLIDSDGNRKDGMFFIVLHTRELALSNSGISRGLIWLRHARASMGHLVVASLMARYILHEGATYRSLLTAYHGLGIGRHAR